MLPLKVFFAEINTLVPIIVFELCNKSKVYIVYMAHRLHEKKIIVDISTIYCFVIVSFVKPLIGF